MHRFTQLDVFAEAPFSGNPLAVIHDADDLTDAQMAAIARWTNLSETTFLLAPTDEAADYRVRIWTTGGELPFAGHPTLGSAQAWLLAGGQPRTDGRVVQECGVGLVTVRLTGERLAFAAPPLLRFGPVDDETLDLAVRGAGLQREDVVRASWCDNGPGWVGLQLVDAEAVLAAVPNLPEVGPIGVGLVGAYPAGGPADVEVRAFHGGIEDPVTGSLNAGLALWLMAEGIMPDHYTARQGTCLQRDGRVFVHRDEEATWIEGSARVVLSGTIEVGR